MAGAALAEIYGLEAGIVMGPRVYGSSDASYMRSLQRCAGLMSLLGPFDMRLERSPELRDHLELRLARAALVTDVLSSASGASSRALLAIGRGREGMGSSVGREGKGAKKIPGDTPVRCAVREE